MEDSRHLKKESDSEKLLNASGEGTEGAELLSKMKHIGNLIEKVILFSPSNLLLYRELSLFLDKNIPS